MEPARNAKTIKGITRLPFFSQLHQQATPLNISFLFLFTSLLYDFFRLFALAAN